MTHSLAILYDEQSDRGLTHPFFSLILNAFQDEAQKRGYDIAFMRNTDDYDYLERYRERGYDGLLLVCVDFDNPIFKVVATSGINCVTIDHIYRHVPSVLSDNENGVQNLVEYAISKGHRRIAFIHGHNNSLVTRTRISQFKNTMDYHNLPVPEVYLQDGLYDNITLTRELVTKLLTLPEPPTCILLPDDLGYLGAQNAAIELELRIPEDISFLGYDGIPLTQTLTPRLTTIRQNSEQLGVVAAQRLIDLIENPNTASRQPTVLPVELIEGGTMANLL